MGFVAGFERRKNALCSVEKSTTERACKLEGDVEVARLCCPNQTPSYRITSGNDSSSDDFGKLPKRLS